MFTSAKITWLSLLLICGIAPLCSAQDLNPIPSDISKIISDIRREHGRLTSFEAMVQDERQVPVSTLEKLKKSLPMDQKFQLKSNSKFQYHFAFKNNKVSLDQVQTDPNTKQVTVSHFISTGDKQYLISHTKQGVMQRDSGQEYGPNGFPGENPLYYGFRISALDGIGTPIADELSSHSYIIIKTENDQKFGRLEVMEGVVPLDKRLLHSSTPGVTVGDIFVKRRFWIAPQFGFLAVRLEETGPVNPDGSPLASGTKPFLMKRRIVKSAHQVSGIWFPDVGEEMSFAHDGTEMSDNHATYTDIAINNIPDSQFIPKLTKGMNYWDAKTNTMYFINDSGKPERDPRGTPDSLRVAAANTSYPNRWLFIVSLTVLLALVFWGLRTRLNR